MRGALFQNWHVTAHLTHTAQMQTTPMQIGLTGGIACGKTTASDAFARLGITVVDADRVARDVVVPGSAGQLALAELLGAGYFDPAGHLNRARLRKAMFADPSLRGRVESILHPLIRDQLLREAAAAPGPYVIVAVPLLVEGGLHEAMDATIVVDCPEAVQRERLRQRDGDSEAQIERILSSQLERDKRLQAADYVLHNAGSPAELERQVRELDEELRRRAVERPTPAGGTAR